MTVAARAYSYPTDTSEEEWAFAAPYLTLLPEAAGQRRHDLRAVYDALRWLVRAGAPWRLLPGDFPPWHAVYDQARRWLAAGVFEAMAHDLRAILRVAEGRAAAPTAAILDSRTMRSTPESGGRAGYDGAKRQNGSKLHAAVDTLGHLLALRVTPADAGDRAQVGQLTAAVQDATGETVEVAYVDQGYTGETAAAAARANGIALHVERTLACRADNWLAQPMPTAGQGLGMPEPLSTRLPALGLGPHHASKTMSANQMIPDRL